MKQHDLLSQNFSSYFVCIQFTWIINSLLFIIISSAFHWVARISELAVELWQISKSMIEFELKFMNKFQTTLFEMFICVCVVSKKLLINFQSIIEYKNRLEKWRRNVLLIFPLFIPMFLRNIKTITARKERVK